MVVPLPARKVVLTVLPPPMLDWLSIWRTPRPLRLRRVSFCNLKSGNAALCLSMKPVTAPSRKASSLSPAWWSLASGCSATITTRFCAWLM
ncbi:hypothetical protein D3C86_1960540 [compost metagenome]